MTAAAVVCRRNGKNLRLTAVDMVTRGEDGGAEWDSSISRALNDGGSLIGLGK